MTASKQIDRHSAQWVRGLLLTVTLGITGLVHSAGVEAAPQNPPQIEPVAPYIPSASSSGGATSHPIEPRSTPYGIAQASHAEPRRVTAKPDPAEAPGAFKPAPSSVPPRTLLPTQSGQGATASEDSSAIALTSDINSDGRVESESEADRQAIPLRRPGESSSEESPMGFKAPAGMFRNTAISLGLVIALFLGVAWMLKKNQPRSQSALPREAVEVLGRVPLSAKQHLQLIRMGPKLLLVSSSGTQMQTLGEISDPSQVDSMIQICQGSGQGAIAQSFQQIMGQFEREPTEGFIGNEPQRERNASSQRETRQRRRRSWT